MAKSKLEKIKGRKERGRFLALPHAVIFSNNYSDLSGNSAKLLNQLAGQYNGSNNGDLQASFNVLKKHGWKSPTTLNKAINELQNKGFILKTRQGHYPKKASLFAITWQPIDKDINGKYDASVRPYIGKTLGWWKGEKARKSLCTESVSS